MNIATVAMDTVWKSPKENIEQTERHVAEVLGRWPETDVILFPESSLMGLPEDETNSDIAEGLDGFCVTEIKRIAQQYNVAVICGMIERNPDGKPYNCLFVVSRTGDLVTYYHKNHLFTESDEPKAYERGADLAVFELEGWTCGLSICFDIRFPRLFAKYKQAGVELMLSGFNWVKGRNKPAIMEALVKARAHENQFFFAAVDRTGSDPTTSYYGTSVISSPYCEDIAERDGIYSYAQITKDDIETLGRVLPLAESFKAEYSVRKAE